MVQGRGDQVVITIVPARPGAAPLLRPRLSGRGCHCREGRPMLCRSRLGRDPVSAVSVEPIFVCLSVLSVCMYICFVLSVGLYWLSVSVSFYMSVCLSVCLFCHSVLGWHPTATVSVEFIFITVSLSFCLSVCLSICLSLCLSFCLSACPFVSVSLCCLSLYLFVCLLCHPGLVMTLYLQ